MATSGRYLDDDVLSSIGKTDSGLGLLRNRNRHLL